MQGDISWDHFDRLVEAYAAACLYIGEVRELEVRIARAMGDLLRQPGTFGDLTSLLATRTPSREMISRRVAWAAQHILGHRAWQVGAKVLVKLPKSMGPDAYGSPLLDQLRLLGFISAGEGEGAGVGDGAATATAGGGATRTAGDGGALSFELPALEKIDALLATPSSADVWLVKGCSYTQAQRVSPDLWVNADRDSLFGQDDRFMTRVHGSVPHIRTLLAARDLVQAAHPQLRVRACYMVINDPGCSWHFQAHDLTSAKPSVLKSSSHVEGGPRGGGGMRVPLDSFNVLATHRAFPEQFSKDGPGLSQLPDWAGSDPLTALPGDRPVRSLLMLHDLWGRQLNRPKRLATASGEDLADSVARTTAVSLGRDQWRHDLEDCLERSGFVRRLPDRPGRFAITPKGVARLMTLRLKLGAGPRINAPQLLSHVSHQARLWAAAPVA